MPQDEGHAPRRTGGAFDDPPAGPGHVLARPEVAAGAAALAWILIAGAHLATGPEEGAAGTGRALLGALVLLAPLGAIWAALAGARAARAARAAAQATMPAPPSAKAPERSPAPAALPPSAPPPAATPGQAAPAPAPLARMEMIRALHFPHDAEDGPGFDALRRALSDPAAAPAIRAAQDALTLLSEDGIYMDELSLPPVTPVVWRRLAGGQRAAALGAVPHEALLERVGARLAADPIFHDATRHFLRQFERALPLVAEGAHDEELDALAETRSARAYRLMGRAAGSLAAP